MARKRKQRSKGKSRGGLQLLEEAVDLVRSAPRSLLMIYYIGAVPFVLALMFFWSHMSRDPMAYEDCGAASLGLAILFIWMKCWQTVFGSELKALASGTQGSPWTVRRVLRMMRIQLILQPLGFILAPIAALIIIPFGQMHAFFFNLTIFGDGTDDGLGSLCKKLWRHASLWPKQNNILIWLASPWTLLMALSISTVSVTYGASLSDIGGGYGSVIFALIYAFMLFMMIFAASVMICPFGAVVLANVGLTIGLLPYLARTLFGINSAFTLNPVGSILNTTFLFATFGITYLYLDRW